MNRPTSMLATVLLFGVAASATAQPLPKASNALQVLTKEATTQEDATVQAVVSRLRAKLTSDTAFGSRLEAAVSRRDFATAGSLLGTAAQLPRKSIVYAGVLRTGMTGSSTGGLFHFASTDSRARFNPWYLIVSVGGRVYCASTSVTTCQDALKKMGYSTTEVLW
jgi:hypothetical protein